MSAERDVQIFSLSFIDLLSCGLASMVILYCLALGAGQASPRSVDRTVGVVVSQIGRWHLLSVRVTDSSGGDIGSSVSSSAAAGPMPLVACGFDQPNTFGWHSGAVQGLDAAGFAAAVESSVGLSIQISPGVDDDRNQPAGSVALLAQVATARCRVTLKFERCDYQEGVHLISVQPIGRGSRTRLLSFARSIATSGWPVASAPFQEFKAMKRFLVVTLVAGSGFVEYQDAIEGDS